MHFVQNPITWARRRLSQVWLSRRVQNCHRHGIIGKVSVCFFFVMVGGGGYIETRGDYNLTTTGLAAGVANPLTTDDGEFFYNASRTDS